MAIFILFWTIREIVMHSSGIFFKFGELVRLLNQIVDSL